MLHSSLVPLQFSLNPSGFCQGEQEGSRVQLSCPLSLSAGSRKARGLSAELLQITQIAKQAAFRVPCAGLQSWSTLFALVACCQWRSRFLRRPNRILKQVALQWAKTSYLPVPLHVELLPLTETAASELTPCRDAETTSGLLSGLGVWFQCP